MNLFWWSIFQDQTPVPEFGRTLPVARLTAIADVLVAAVAALTVFSLVAFPDGSPNWLYYVRFFGVTFAGQATVQWVRHLVTNLRLRQRRPLLGKNMAFFGWFLPPLVPILPAIQFAELSKKSTPPGKSSAGPQFLVFVWFLTALAWAGTQFVAFQYWFDATDPAQDGSFTLNTTPREWLVYGAVTQVLGALAYIAMTQAIRRQHEAFIEATEPPAAEIAAQAEAWRASRPYAEPPPGMPVATWSPDGATPSGPPHLPPPTPPTGRSDTRPPGSASAPYRSY